MGIVCPFYKDDGEQRVNFQIRRWIRSQTFIPEWSLIIHGTYHTLVTATCLDKHALTLLSFLRGPVCQKRRQGF